MRFFHIDRQNTLPESGDVKLLPLNHLETYSCPKTMHFFRGTYCNINQMGKLYLNPLDVNISDFNTLCSSCYNALVFAAEYAFESVRLAYFPTLPSRFSSIYACESKENVRFWCQQLGLNNFSASTATVKIIEARHYFYADAMWRDGAFDFTKFQKPEDNPFLGFFSPFDYHVRAHSYWNGEKTDFPKMEVLCALPITIVCSVPLVEFLSGMQ